MKPTLIKSLLHTPRLAVGVSQALLGLLVAHLSGPSLHAETNQQHSVLASATVVVSPASVNLAWSARSDAVSYEIGRRLPGTATWTTLATLNSNAASLTGWSDTSVAVGTLYEYRVKLATNTVNSTSNPTANVTAFSYLWSGVDVPLVESRGTLVVLVDQTITTSLQTEIDRYIRDLRGDGWNIVRHNVARHEVGATGWKEAVVANHTLIKAARDADASVRGVVLLGRVPVPYSGLNLAPDAHTDHAGAWPADLYYGVMDTNVWSDSFSNTSASRTENRNQAGDGKFDQDSLFTGSSVELFVGRIDLANMPAFNISEVELLRSYFNKNHAFRNAQTVVPRRGLIDANIESSFSGKYSASAYRAYAALFGASGITAADYIPTLQTQGQ